MKRRIFLGSLMAVVGAIWPSKRSDQERLGCFVEEGWITCNEAREAENAKTPARRWEWAVEEWGFWWNDGVGQRDWYVDVTLFADEVSIIIKSAGLVNSISFNEVVSGHIRILAVEFSHIGDGMVDAKVVLREMTEEQGLVCCMTPGEPMQVVQCVARVDFNELFQGSHSIVNVGGREVA